MKRKIVLASHGELAKGLLHTAQMIVGKLPCEAEVYSLQPGALADDYAKELKEEIQQHKDTEYVILTDIYGASVFSAMLSCVELENVTLFSGMNLNMLLSICLEHQEVLQETAIQQIVKDAREGIQHVQLQKEATMEDF